MPRSWRRYACLWIETWTWWALAVVVEYSGDGVRFSGDGGRATSVGGAAGGAIFDCGRLRFKRHPEIDKIMVLVSTCLAPLYRHAPSNSGSKTIV